MNIVVTYTVNQEDKHWKMFKLLCPTNENNRGEDAVNCAA